MNNFILINLWRFFWIFKIYWKIQIQKIQYKWSVYNILAEQKGIWRKKQLFFWLYDEHLSFLHLPHLSNFSSITWKKDKRPQSSSLSTYSMGNDGSVSFILRFLKLEGESLGNIPERYRSNAVPYLMLIKKGTNLTKLNKI